MSRFVPCSGQSRGPRHWAICYEDEPGRRRRARDAAGRVRLFGSYEAAKRAADALEAHAGQVPTEKGGKR